MTNYILPFNVTPTTQKSEKLGEGICRQQGNLISLLLFFENKESRLITKICRYDDDQSTENSCRCYIT
jgi:hypothetical protein